MYNSITVDDYKFVENEAADFYGVRLTSGPYTDVIIVYGQVSVKEEVDSDGRPYGKLSFNYNIQDLAGFDNNELVKSEDFNNYIGDVLHHIIEDTLASGEAVIGNQDTTTDAHSESPSD